MKNEFKQTKLIMAIRFEMLMKNQSGKFCSDKSQPHWVNFLLHSHKNWLDAVRNLYMYSAVGTR